MKAYKSVDVVKTNCGGDAYAHLTPLWELAYRSNHEITYTTTGLGEHVTEVKATPTQVVRRKAKKKPRPFLN